jgi:hypothetical protein
VREILKVQGATEVPPCSGSLILENASTLEQYPSLKKFMSSFKFSDLGWAPVFFSLKIVCNQIEDHPYEDVKKVMMIQKKT